MRLTSGKSSSDYYYSKQKEAQSSKNMSPFSNINHSQRIKTAVSNLQGIKKQSLSQYAADSYAASSQLEQKS